MSTSSSASSLLTPSSSTNSAIDISNILAASSGSSTAGIDVTSAVAAAIYADNAPERGWLADQTTLSSQTTALTAIQTATEAVQTDMESLNTLTGPLAARTVDSSNSNYLTATASTGTALGTHAVVINSLASTASWYSDLESSPTSTLPSSSLTITMADAPNNPITFATGASTSGDTLNDLAIAINSTQIATSYNSSATTLSSSTALTAGSVTTIQDGSTGQTFTYTAAAGDTVGDLNTAIAAAVTAGTLSANVAGSVNSSGEEVISEGSTDAGITVSSTDAAFGTMGTTAGATSSLGVTATVVSDATGSVLSIVSNTSGTAAGFSVTSPNYTGTSWTSPELPTGSTLGANSITLTSSAGTTTINTTSGETYAQLATAISGAQIATSYNSSASTLSSSTALTAGSVTTIQDTGTGKTFTYTAVSGNTVGDLNNAIAAAVTAGTLSANVTGSVVGGQEVISEGSTDQGIVVSSNDSVLGTMGMTSGATTPLGLTATSGSNSNGTYLTITGSSSFTINEPSFGFTQATAAANASLTVDGVPISSATNTVTGAIPGVTLSLLGAAPGSQLDLTVASDATSISTAINQFVTDYNSAIGLLNTQFALTSTTNSSGTTTSSQGVLASDPTVVQLQSSLEQALDYVYTPTSGTTTVSTLSDLGITVGDDGTLTVDSTTLDNALTNNPTDVQNFFEGSSLNGFANSMYSAVNTYTTPSTGAFAVDLSSIASENSDLTSEINDFENGYIASQQTLLTAEYTTAEEALQALPEEMQQLNSELGFNNNGSNS